MNSAIRAAEMSRALIDDTRRAVIDWHAASPANTDQVLADAAGLDRTVICKFRGGNIDLSTLGWCKILSVLGYEMKVSKRVESDRCDKTIDLFKEEGN